LEEFQFFLSLTKLLETKMKARKCTKDGIGWVHGYIVLGSFSNMPLGLSEGDIGRSGTVSLVVGDDLYSTALPHSNAGVCRAEIDPDRWSIAEVRHAILLWFEKQRAEA
jgi:NAD-specific glutamate dehydrogenase